MAQKRDRRQNRLIRKQLWRERVEAWHESGQTQSAFCRAQGLSLTSFSRWKSELVERDRSWASAAATDSPLPGSEAMEWTELRLPSARAARCEAWLDSSGFEIVLPQGWSVRMGPQFEAEPLRRLLSVLEERSC